MSRSSILHGPSAAEALVFIGSDGTAEAGPFPRPFMRRLLESTYRTVYADSQIQEAAADLLSVALTHEVTDSGVSSGERLFVRQEDDTEVFCAWTLAEAGAVYHHHVLLAD